MRARGEFSRGNVFRSSNSTKYINQLEFLKMLRLNGAEIENMLRNVIWWYIGGIHQYIS